MTSWYESLADYFPEHEMKSLAQMQGLLHAQDAYHVQETSDYLIVYAEYANFIFLDYLLVNPNTRGRGVGGQVIERFQTKNKVLLAELEPPNTGEPDTLRRIRFYERNGFQQARQIGYSRFSDDGRLHDMQIFYWSPYPVSERTVLLYMTQVCQEIHNFRAERYYGRMIADPSESLRWKTH